MKPLYDSILDNYMYPDYNGVTYGYDSIQDPIFVFLVILNKETVYNNRHVEYRLRRSDFIGFEVLK